MQLWDMRLLLWFGYVIAWCDRSQKDPHFTIAHHRVLSSSVVRASDRYTEGRGFKSHLELGFFSEFEFDASVYYNYFWHVSRRRWYLFPLILHTTIKDWPRYFEPPLFRTIFSFPEDLEITKFNCSHFNDVGRNVTAFLERPPSLTFFSSGYEILWRIFFCSSKSLLL